MDTERSAEGTRTARTLDALTTLLDEMHLAAPERLPESLARAGSAVGLQVLMYLVDYQQQTLAPVPVPGLPVRTAIDVETSLAGRAFREVRTLTGKDGGRDRLWVPLLDGVERLGVLEVLLPEGTSPDDQLLRNRCRWLSYLVGHLVSAVNDYGDELDRVRRTRRRTPAAELIWQLLPPPTAGVGSFTVSGHLEPSDEVGGDAFDYALSATTAHLAVFDATGHSILSGATAAAALSAYRSARRNGGGLYDQAMAIDEAIGQHFMPEGRFVTGVLCELDLSSGRLRYVVAGHPRPLILRHGKVVKSLQKGLRPLFGLQTAELTIGEEMLERGDWLALFSDGVTEARDADGREFGIDRLIDFLQREAASGYPPPETVRRLARAVMTHQGGVLQDDATVLLARWDGSDLSA